MSLLDAYAGLMESVTWRARSSIDQYGDPSYTDTTISVIWYDDQKLIRNEQGEELQQLAYIQTTSLVQQGDLIVRGGYSWPIIGIMRTPTFEGEQFRIANLGGRQV
jgi:hypothetical protein